jgi:uncharacterized protein YijF (DUF1287 family)
MRKLVFVVVMVVIALVLGTPLLRRSPSILRTVANTLPAAKSHDLDLIASPVTPADKIVNGAKKQAIDRVVYDASYQCMRYPGGDVVRDRGACTDVIIRALRNAGYDLQQLIHEDIAHNFSLYPRKWGLDRPDSNIDHRRVPNHLVFMRRFARELSKETTGAALRTWKPGDLVYWDLGNGCTHCGVVSNVIGTRKLPLIIHNIGPWASQDDVLDSWKVLGHFRYPKV